MGDLRFTIKKDARRALRLSWGKAIAILIILIGVNTLFFVLDKGVQELFPINFYESDYIEDFIKQINNIPIVLVILAFIISVMRFVIEIPLEIGKCEWFLGLTDGRSQPVAEIFSPFGSKVFPRSIGANILLAIFTTLWSLLFTVLPVAAICFGIYYIDNTVQTAQNGLIALMCLVLGTALLLIAIILLSVLLQRYFLVNYLLTSRYSMTPMKAIKTSVQFTKGRLWELFILNLSFVPWILLCVFIIPVFYVFPYIETTFAIYARYLIESGKRGESPFTREFETNI